MPTKQIYVKKEDLVLFEKAEKYGNDNFSKFVIETLREYVKQQEKKVDSQGFSLIDLEVGQFLPEPENISIKRIRGKQIAYHEIHEVGAAPWDRIEAKENIFLTKKGNYVFWSRSCFLDEDQVDENGEYIPQESAQLVVLDHLPDIPEENVVEIEELRISRELLAKAHEAVGDRFGDIEELDV